MAQKDNTKQNNPISLNELPIQSIEDITKQIISKVNNPFDEVKKQIIDRMNKDREDAQYSKEQVLQMRENNDSRLYKTPEDANRINAGGYVWENGKVGYFIPFQHREMGYDFIQPQFGGGQKDGKGLRFVQIHRDSSKLFAYPQSNNIVISGFGEYVLENWGKDLSELCSKYTTEKYKKRVEQWRKDNYPTKMDKQTDLQLLNDLKNAECDQWNKAMISEFFTATDYEKLKQCMNEYFNWFDNYMQMERNKKEKQFINLIKNGVISENWVNGKIGKFTFDNTRFEYRFLEGMRDYQDKDEILQQPVLSCGFVAWLIKHWGEDTPAIYSGYLQAKLNDYKAEHKKDADVLNRNLEREFYDQYRSEEEQWVKQSEAIFDFISEPEVNKIKEYVKYYFKHVSQFETKGKTDKVNIGKEQPYRVELDKETESKVLETYRFWNSTEKYIQTRTPIITNNIFKDTTQKEFLEMVSAADFSKLYNTKGIKQRVGQNIVALSKIINSDEWTGQATTKLNTTIRALQKNTQFHEYEDLKNKFIQ